jgi:hypothetical protein
MSRANSVHAGAVVIGRFLESMWCVAACAACLGIAVIGAGVVIVPTPCYRFCPSKSCPGSRFCFAFGSPKGIGPSVAFSASE